MLTTDCVILPVEMWATRPVITCAGCQIRRDESGQWEQIVGWEWRTALTLDGDKVDELAAVWQDIADPTTAGGPANSGGGCMNVNGSYVCPTNIDKYNPMERGKTNLRDFNLFCSTHVTIDQTTGQTASHVDLVNPEPLPVGPVSPAVWPVLHVIYDGFPDLIYRTTGMYLVPPGRSLCQ